MLLGFRTLQFGFRNNNKKNPTTRKNGAQLLAFKKKTVAAYNTCSIENPLTSCNQKSSHKHSRNENSQKQLVCEPLEFLKLGNWTGNILVPWGTYGVSFKRKLAKQFVAKKNALRTQKAPCVRAPQVLKTWELHLKNPGPIIYLGYKFHLIFPRNSISKKHTLS